MHSQLPCSVVQDLLPQYVENLLLPESEREVAEHLKECEACREIYRQMNCPEPIPIEAVREVDYLKKVKHDRIKILAGSALTVLAVVACSLFFLHHQRTISMQYAAKADEMAAKATEYAEKASEYAALVSENAKNAEQIENVTGVSYDRVSKTVIVFGMGDDVNVEFPDELNEAKNLDAQFDGFHLSIYLPTLQTDESLDSFLNSYLDRTNRSLNFLRSYLRDNCLEEFFSDRLDKYVEISIMRHEGHSWMEHDDRVSLEMGSYYWYREVLYLLSVIGNQNAEWKELGYAWYLGCCVDPYSEYRIDFDDLQASPYYDAFLNCGGTLENTPENVKKTYDAIAYTCLTQGMNWGTSYESHPLMNIALYGGSKNSKDPGNEMSVIMAASFIGYLVESYGFERVSACCFRWCSFEQAFGTDYQTAYEAWSARIVESCGQP